MKFLSLLAFGSATFAASVASALLSSDAYANVSEKYGLGSRMGALGSSGAAFGAGPYSTFTNPALLLFETDREKLLLSWGVVIASPSLTPINSVVTQNTVTSTSTKSGSVDTDLSNTLGQELALAYRFDGESPFALGLTAYLPADPIATVDTGEPYVPEYVLERSRTQRPQFALALGHALGDQLSLGAGINFAFNMTSKAEVYLQSDPTLPSWMRVSASLKPKAAFYTGLAFRTPSHNTSLGLVLRLPQSSNQSLTLRAGEAGFGNITSLDAQFQAQSALFYDPLTVELGLAHAWTSSQRTLLQVDFQKWNDFVPPTLVISGTTSEDCTGAGCPGSGLAISPSQNPKFAMKNIFIPRIGQEWDLGSWMMRVGYFYRPGLVDTSRLSDSGNLLDPARHAFSLGAGFQRQKFLHLNLPWKLDLYVLYQQLVSQKVVKTAGNEAGNMGDSKIGSPGYTVGGKVYGGGITLSFAW